MKIISVNVEKSSKSEGLAPRVFTLNEQPTEKWVTCFNEVKNSFAYKISLSPAEKELCAVCKGYEVQDVVFALNEFLQMIGDRIILNEQNESDLRKIRDAEQAQQALNMENLYNNLKF
ncbi:hypothetical protein PF334_004447 [Salmonella enterica]|nr:hypothetical protein [Salmonella enterica]ECE6501174.1 hypothetical protein [Salmonella enterica subsp. salamae]EAW4327831.1 hypothetical protein [Salmonella enterica]EAZ5330758.1 hypothetical protein [Salmonella enterica]EBA2750262.1 hypothetical protein [Salmonella enterica]